VRDTATFAQPHRYAEGMRYVFVNGVQVLRDGEPTDARPGRVIRGPGWRPYRARLIARAISAHDGS
jgi:N-acyl-D-amino-acid deacylase